MMTKYFYIQWEEVGGADKRNPGKIETLMYFINNSFCLEYKNCSYPKPQVEVPIIVSRIGLYTFAV